MTGFEPFFPKNTVSFFILEMIWFLNNGVGNVKKDKICTMYTIH